MTAKTLRILLVEDERLLGRSIQRFLSDRETHCEWCTNTEEAILLLKRESIDLVVSDVRLPQTSGIELLHWVLTNQPHVPLILITAHSSVKEAVDAIREGASDYLCKPLDLETLELTIHRILETRQLKREVLYHRGKPAQEMYFLLDTTQYHEIERMIQRLVEIENRNGETPSVFLTGETGTGKGSLSRRIHQQSPRREGPFIVVNSTAIPETMFESELFGHEKGAFTGAVSQRTGLFELADGGTLFLDEIGHLPPAIQSKFLKVLEDKKFRRIGGVREIEVDVRIVAATNLNLQLAMNQGEFREDLFHRLGLVHMRLPALREIHEAIPALVEFVLEQSVRKYPPSLNKSSARSTGKLKAGGDARGPRDLLKAGGDARGPRDLLKAGGDARGPRDFVLEQSVRKYPPSFNKSSARSTSKSNLRQFISNAGMKNLVTHHWPGNIRELKNEIERAIMFFHGDPLDFEHLKYLKQGMIAPARRIASTTETSGGSVFQLPAEGFDLLQLEPRLISQAMEQSSGDVEGAAKLLKMTQRELEYRLDKHQLPEDQHESWGDGIPESGIELSELERDYIRQALERTGNNVTRTARLLNLSRDQMRYRLEKHGIST